MTRAAGDPGPTACPAEFIALAGRMADEARLIALRHFRTGLRIETKPDASPVTEADRAIEQTLRELIEDAFPEHGILGEEFAPVREGAEHVWVIDPIDGTKAFASGLPVFTTMIGLLQQGQPILGLVDQPFCKERWLGAAGQETTMNGRAVRTARTTRLDEASLHATTPEMFSGEDTTRFEQLAAMTRFRHYGAECYAYGLLASGHLELVVEADLKPHDFLPVVRIVAGAGGVISDWQGQAPNPASDGRILAAATAELHAAALAVLSV